MHYLDYNNMKDFYTVQELADLLGLHKEQLHTVSKQYRIEPQKCDGCWCFDRWQSCQIHNKLYKQGQATQTNDDPWA